MLNLIRNQSGQDIMEYALLVCLLALGAIAAMGTVATEVNTVFNTFAVGLDSSL